MKIFELKKILKNDIYIYRNRIEALKEQIENLEKGIFDVENGKASSQAQKILYQKYRLRLTEYNLKEYLPTLKSDLFMMNTQLDVIINVLDSTIKAYQALHYHQIVSPNLMGFIKNRLLKENLDDVEIITTMEYIKIHNTKCHENKGRSLSSSDLYLVLNILDSSYEKIEIEPMSDEKLENNINSVLNAIESNPLSAVDDIVNLKHLTYDEQIYVWKRVLKHYQDEIYEIISLLKNKDFYFDITLLQTIKEEYKVLYQKYMFARNELDQIHLNKKANESIEPKKEEIVILENEDIQKLFYATNTEDPTKCYFMKDILDMREESYKTILDLIKTFKEGNNKNTKYLSTNSNFIELKSDQVRIVLKPLGNNNYSVQGVFIKKSDNDRYSYENLFHRPVAQINPEYSRQVEAYYIPFLEENKRKGSR